MAHGPITRENTYTYIHTRPWGSVHCCGANQQASKQASRQAGKFRSCSTDDERNGRLVCVFRLFPGMWKDLDGWMDGKQDISNYLPTFRYLSILWPCFSRMDAHFIFSFPSLPACYTTTTPGVTLGVIYLSIYLDKPRQV